MRNTSWKPAVAALLGSAAILCAGAADALTITLGDASNNESIPGPGNDELLSRVPGVTTINFDDPLPAGVSLSGDYQIVMGDLAGDSYAAAPQNPFGEGGLGNDDASLYLSVPDDAPGSAIIDLPGSFLYYGLWWGSIDRQDLFGQEIKFFSNG
ncbi:MAG: hypothetical protein JRG83_03095, partial [Deltaproteobacteria bacterium]|nr:hypothetical protein [Deltaproteobacteria bacterium]